jgi:beta-lactamase class D
LKRGLACFTRGIHALAIVQSQIVAKFDEVVAFQQSRNGSEAWNMSHTVTAALRGFNYWIHDRVIAATSKEKPVDASFDLEGYIQWARLRWLGHTWRMEKHSGMETS